MVLKRLLRVRNTNDLILQAFSRENNDSDDGIYFNVIERTLALTVTPGAEVKETNIIKRSDIFPNESVTNLVLDTNDIDHPSGYIISLCFSTFDNNSGKLYMGRVTINGSMISWTQCADSPKVYANQEILNITSSFLNYGEGKPIKTISLRAADGNVKIIIEHH